MKTRGILICSLLAVIAATLWAQSALAVPVFARKYGFNCTMCHSNVPRLNDFGQRYRMNGYRLPGPVNVEKTVLETPAPVAFRTTVGYSMEHLGSVAKYYYGTETEGGFRKAGNESDFRMNGLDILSAGLLGPRIGYLMVYVPPITAARGLAEQEGTLEMASLVLSDLAGSWLNARVGRFEPAYVPFSVKRQLSVAPYEVYDLAFPGGPALSETQSGIELSGYGPQRFQYAAGWVDGSATNAPDDTPADFYGRAAYVIQPGEGQTVGQRLGVIGYLGSARPMTGTQREKFSRLGVDASLNVSMANLALQYLWAADDKTLWGADENVDYSGGFAELSVLPMVNLVGFARLDLINQCEDYGFDVNRYTVGGRYYLEDNVAVHAEYSYRVVKDAVVNPVGASVVEIRGDATSASFTARLDFVF
jgi:hypothetical protein